MEECGQSIFRVRCHSQDWPVTQPSGVLWPGHICPHLQKGSLCPGATQGPASPFSELPEVSDPFFLIPPPRPSPAVGPPLLSCPPRCLLFPFFLTPTNVLHIQPCLGACFLEVQNVTVVAMCPHHGFVCNFWKMTLRERVKDSQLSCHVDT